MKTSGKSVLIKGLGVAVAALVPAIVVAQSLPSFTAGNVLRAGDLQALSNNLNNVLTRLNALENQSGASPLSKANVYDTAAASTPVSSGAVGDAFALCADESDILLNCTCAGAANSRAVDLRIIQVADNSSVAQRSVCGCTGENIGATDNTISARATCLRVP